MGSNLCHQRDDLFFCWAAFIILSSTLVAFRFATRHFREFAFGLEGSASPEFVNVYKTDHQEHKVGNWREAVCEAEDHGCSIFMSYMVKVLVMKHMFGHYHLHLEEHSKYDVVKLFVAQLVFIGALVAFTYWRRSLHHDKYAHDHATSIQVRSMSSLNTIISMSMSWLAFVFFHCLTMHLFPGISEEFGNIVSAAILTACAIVCIIVLDLC